VGLYAQDTIGDRLPWLFGAILLAWVVVPLAIAMIGFSRRSPV